MHKMKANATHGPMLCTTSTFILQGAQTDDLSLPRILHFDEGKGIKSQLTRSFIVQNIQISAFFSRYQNILWVGGLKPDKLIQNNQIFIRSSGCFNKMIKMLINHLISRDEQMTKGDRNHRMMIVNKKREPSLCIRSFWLGVKQQTHAR